MWWKKYVKIAIIVIVIGLIGFGIYKLAGVLVNSTYSSRELVEEQVEENGKEEQNSKESSNEELLDESSNLSSTSNTVRESESTEINPDIQQGTKQEGQSNQDFIILQTKAMLKDSPYPELSTKENSNYLVSVDENEDYTVSIGDYTFGFYKDSLAFRYLAKSSEFTESEINWLSPDGNTQWFTEEDGMYIYR